MPLASFDTEYRSYAYTVSSKNLLRNQAINKSCLSNFSKGSHSKSQMPLHSQYARSLLFEPQTTNKVPLALLLYLSGSVSPYRFIAIGLMLMNYICKSIKFIRKSKFELSLRQMSRRFDLERILGQACLNCALISIAKCGAEKAMLDHGVGSSLTITATIGCVTPSSSSNSAL